MNVNSKQDKIEWRLITILTSLEQVIPIFYVKHDDLGFKYKCVEHNHLNNKDDNMNMHLLKEHDMSIPFKNWMSMFILFSVGDSYSNSYRCSLCRAEFLFEKDAKAHFVSEGGLFLD